MMLIEKVVKLLDDFHFNTFREYVRDTSLRSYYPLALIDVIDRNFKKEQTIEKLFFQTYGKHPEEEKEIKKLHQLGHHTFKMTGYLAKNYPNYLQHNITRIQHLINTGKLEDAVLLAYMTKDVAEKIEDFDTEIKVLEILAMREVFLDSIRETLRYFERIEKLLKQRSDLNFLNTHIFDYLKDKGKDSGNLQEKLDLIQPFIQNDSFAVQIIAKLNRCYFYYLHRDPLFYQPEILELMVEIETVLSKNDYVIFPFLHNIRSKLHFLKLNYSIRQLEFDKVLEEANQIMLDSKGELFWNSFVNLPEMSSIGIQSSYLVSNYFTSYRADHLSLLSDDIKHQINVLKTRCKTLLSNKTLEEKFTVRYINLTTVYASLLLLGDKNDIKESIDALESLLIFYQQTPFHSAIDTVYIILTLGNFSIKNYDNIEKLFRRYKKATKNKVVNEENDQTLLGFYFLSKWIDTRRDQYVKKLENVIADTDNKANLSSTKKLLTEVANYFNVPLKG